MGNKSNGKATTSLVLGIVSIIMVFFGFYGSLIGMICGIIGIVLSNKAKKVQPSGCATGGFVCSIIGLVLCAVVFVFCLLFLGTLASIASNL